MSEYVMDYTLKGRSGQTPASFFSDNSSVMNKSRGAASKPAEEPSTGAYRSRPSSTNKYEQSNLNISRVPGTLGPQTPAFAPEMPTFGKPAFMSTLQRPNGRSQSPYGAGMTSSPDEAYQNLNHRRDTLRESLTFGKNPLRDETNYRDGTRSRDERTGKGFNGSTLDTSSNGLVNVSTNFDPFFRQRNVAAGTDAFNSPAKRSPTFMKVDNVGRNKAYSDVLGLQSCVYTALNRRSIAFCLIAIIVDYLLYYSFGIEDSWSFTKIVCSRVTLSYFLLEGQVKLMGMVPFDLLSFIRFKYFENTWITLLSMLQLLAIMNFAWTFDTLLAVSTPRSSVENTFAWCHILVISNAFHYYSCTLRLVNRFMPYTTFLNFPKSIMASLSKPVAHFIGVFILTICFSWTLAWFVLAVQDDSLLYGGVEVVLATDSESVAAARLTDLFSYSCIKSAVVLFTVTYVYNIYAAMIQWIFCSILIEGLLDKKQFDLPAKNFCLYSDTLEGPVLRASTIVDYHSIANLERYPKAIGELVNTLDTRQIEYAELSTKDRSWELICLYTLDNLNFVRTQCQKRVLTEREEREREAAINQSVMYGVDTCDSFLNHCKLETRERKFALYVANRGELLLANLRVFRLFVEKLQASQKAETLMKNPLVQEVKTSLQNLEMELADFLKLSADRSGPSGRRFSYGFSTGRRIADFHRQFCQVTSSIFLTTRH